MESDEIVFVPWIPGHPLHQEWMHRLWHNDDDFEPVFNGFLSEQGVCALDDFCNILRDHIACKIVDHKLVLKSKLKYNW